MNVSRSCRRARTTDRGSRRGFTLMEVLLTAILSATLLMGLWSLFGTYLRLFETGETRAAKSQLLRALTRQISDDLRSCLQPNTGKPAARGQSSGAQPLSSSSTSSGGISQSNGFPDNGAGQTPAPSSSATVGLSVPGRADSQGPRFGLVGNERTLRIEVLQADPTPGSFDDSMENRTQRGRVSAFETPTPKVGELRTILYTFARPRVIRPNDREPPPGLIRRELDWQTWQGGAEGRDEMGAVSASSAADSTEDRSSGFPQLRAADLADSEQLDERTIWAREVADCLFRYYDGSSWATEWDSHQQGSLPTAVEVTLRLQSKKELLAELDDSDTTDAESEMVAGRDDSDDERDERTNSEEDLRGQLRQVIFLPASIGQRADSQALNSVSNSSLFGASSLSDTEVTP